MIVRCLFLIFCLELGFESNQAAGVQTQQKFEVSDILAAWKDLEYAFPSQLKTTSRYTDKHGVTSEYFQEYKQQGSFCRSHGVSRPDGSMVVRAWNKDYWFEVIQPKGSKSWALAGCGELPIPRNFETVQLVIQSEMKRGIFYEMVSLLELFSDPGFTVKKIVADQFNTDLVEVQFQFRPSENLEKKPGVKVEEAGCVWLSKTMGFRAVKTRSKNFEFEMAEYPNSGSGKIYVTPSRFRQRWVNTTDEELHSSQMSFIEIDPSEFRLSAFGLIEPKFVSESNSKLRNALLGALILIFVMVLWIWWHRRKSYDT